MKKRPSVALFSAGKLTDSPVTRFRGLTDQLGPVKAPSLRLASRVVNTLRAGHPVDNCDEFAGCSLILLSVPDDTAPAAVAELSGARLTWHNTAVVLCSTWLDASSLQPLAACGASVGTITPVPGFDNHKYLVEGDRVVLREAQRLLKYRGAKILAVEPPLKPFFLAALNCTSALLYSLLIAATECLRVTGVPQAESAAILHRQVEKTLRSYLVTGKNAVPPARDLWRQLEALAVVQPAIAEYVAEVAKASAKLTSQTYRAAAPRSSSTP